MEEATRVARMAFESGKTDEALKALSSLDGDEWAKEQRADVRVSQPTGSTGVFPRISGVKWRVDVAISTSSLERVMRPSIMMELTLSDGSIKTFEMHIEQFHKLRYSVARVLRNMQDVERNPIMRLCDADAPAK